MPHTSALQMLGPRWEGTGCLQCMKCNGFQIENVVSVDAPQGSEWEAVASNTITNECMMHAFDNCMT